MAVLELETPPRLLAEKDGLYIPLFLPLGVEKDQVITDVVRQLREIAELLKVISANNVEDIGVSEGEPKEGSAEPQDFSDPGAEGTDTDS